MVLILKVGSKEASYLDVGGNGLKMTRGIWSTRFYCIFLVMCMTMTARPSAAQDWQYTVRPGDNLWDISEKYLLGMGYWKPLQEMNNIERPRNMEPGSTIRIPVRWLRLQPASVRVLAVAGEATAIDADTEETVPVETGMMLSSGDIIETESESSVTVEFADGSQFLIQENSEIEFDTLSAYSDSGMVDTRMRLQRGRLDGETAPSRGPGTAFEVWTPASISAVRGTEYRVATEADGQTSLTEVLRGEVRVEGSGRSQLIPESFGSITAAGEPPSPPIPLLPAPNLTGLPSTIDRVPLRFSLPPLEGAVAYRLQIAADLEFNAVLFDRIFTEPRFVGPNAPDGTYLWRVRGIDDNGLEGLDAYSRFVVDARPEPPFPIRPNEGETIRQPRPDFGWTEPEDARSYRFQLAAEGDFSAPLINLTDHSATSFNPDSDLTPGSYQWRVATNDVAGEEGPFSDPQPFLLRPAPVGPEIEEPAIDPDMLVLRWRAGLPGQTYQVQLARDANFSEIVLDRTIEEARLETRRPIAGRYYLRVRTIDVDGYVGEFGPAQQFEVRPTSYWPLVIVPLMLLLGFL